ncbi:FAD-binding oxidoreductase [Marinomonas agarivorans]|nr:FAD-binding oxidoreductase [Marinomonas agarivorans]
MYTDFLADIHKVLPEEQIIQDELRTLAYGTDASFYRLIPKAVLKVKNQQEVINIVKAAHKYEVPITFRAAGTSLSGQAITDHILVSLGNDWQDYDIIDNGHKIRVQPGLIGAKVNKILAPFSRRIGPDPASINTAKIGGIAANNASGMCCGTANNTYHTVDSIQLVLSDGTTLDTGDEQSVEAFRKSHSSLLEGLTKLSKEVHDTPALKEKIKHKYRLKNTTGYALNSLIDFHDPIKILEHLMIGSEGTLGFISSIQYNTIHDSKHKASALIFFNSVESACQAVSAIKSSPVDAVELMDWPALKSVKNTAPMIGVIDQLPEGCTALLIETHAIDDQSLDQKIADISATLTEKASPPCIPYQFSKDASLCAQYWSIRKGIFPAVGAVREVGSTVIIEDVAYPVEQLADAVNDLHTLFKKWSYNEAVIFGHALEGNIHFVFPQSFNTESDIERYDGLMQDVASLTVGKYQGSLKAEHGTGRNMAPFVELEWGQQAYRIMQDIKQLFDPKNILNPGVILNENANIHVSNIKPMPAAHELVDPCIECGFCEPSCPSKNLTLTPRQRIVIAREMSRLKNTETDQARLSLLEKDYQYQGIDSCAACGLCSTVCPVGINTGDLTRWFRHSQNVEHENKADWVANHFSSVTKASKLGLDAANLGRKVIGNKLMKKAVKATNMLTNNMVGEWRPNTPAANRWKIPTRHNAIHLKDVETSTTDKKHTQGKVVYFPSCVNRTMGIDPQQQDQRTLTELTINLLEKAGYEVVTPNNLSDLCCGMPFKSKGFFDTASKKQDQLHSELFKASEKGKWPILFDTSPCFSNYEEGQNSSLTYYDPIKFALEKLVPKLDITPTDECISLHITCSTTKSGLAASMQHLAQQLSNNVIIPEEITCCGFAGDKGFSLPELNRSALSPLQKQIPAECKRGVSSSRTCEIGLSEHGNIPYHSIFYLLDSVSTRRTTQ